MLSSRPFLGVFPWIERMPVDRTRHARLPCRTVPCHAPPSPRPCLAVPHCAHPCLVRSFHALTANIRARRGGRVAIRAPLFADTHTEPAALAEGIAMDAMAFGMGCCCLQVTFQVWAHRRASG